MRAPRRTRRLMASAALLALAAVVLFALFWLTDYYLASVPAGHRPGRIGERGSSPRPWPTS
jgi:hypothetical protein